MIFLEHEKEDIEVDFLLNPSISKVYVFTYKSPSPQTELQNLLLFLLSYFCQCLIG